MQYPQDFIDAAKKEYPDWKELHGLLDKDSPWVGGFLDDSSCGKISPDELLEADTEPKMLALKQRAATLKYRRELWAWWRRLNDEQRER